MNCLLRGEFHEDRIVVGVAELFLVIRESMKRLVVEDVVDADHLLPAAEGVHEATTALLETVDFITEHGVIDVRVGYVVEVTAYDDGNLSLAHIHCQHVGLSRTGYHADGVVAVDGADQRIS